MKIENINPVELHDYKNNPRDNIEAIDKVAASIEEFGFKVPIIVDDDNVIIAGHTRKQAAMELGLDTVPVIRADDLTEKQVRAFRLADNKVAEYSVWDNDLLKVELEELQEEIDMLDFGFDPVLSDFDDDDTDFEIEEEAKGYSITYEIAFNNEDEQERWYDFLGTLRKEYPDVDTISERILLAVGAWQSGK